MPQNSLTHRLATRVLHNAPIAIVVLDLDGQIVYVNPYFERLTGFEGPEIVGRDWFDTFVRAGDRDVLRAAFRGSVLGERLVGHVDAVVTRAGDERDIEWNDELLKDEHGRPTSVLTMGVDVTERVKASRLIAASEGRLREAQSIAKVGSWELDLVTNRLTWSSEIFTIFELDEARFEASYSGFLAAIHPEDRDAVNSAYLGSVERGEPYEIAHRLLLAGGRTKWVQERGQTFYDAVGKPLRSAGTVQDISATVGAQLLDRDTRLSAVFNHGWEAMLLFTVAPDGTLRVAAANRVFLSRLRQIRAVDEADLVGLTFEQLTLDVYGRPQEILDGYLKHIRQVLEERTPHTFEHSMQFPSSLLIAEVSLLPVLGPTGKCSYLLWSSRDVTANRLAYQQLSASLAEKETLLREVHHRVKNNLQVISGLLHFHAKKLPDPSQANVFKELRQRIMAMTLVHERLYQSANVAHVDFAQYVRSLVFELQRSFDTGISDDERGRVELTTAVDEVALPIGLAVPSGLIISELVTNALKHAFIDGRRGRVTVAVRRDGANVALCVDDDGLGFVPQDHSRANAAFGWELIRSLATQLDATVELRSHNGTQVQVTFPLPT